MFKACSYQVHFMLISGSYHVHIIVMWDSFHVYIMFISYSNQVHIMLFFFVTSIQCFSVARTCNDWGLIHCNVPGRIIRFHSHRIYWPWNPSRLSRTRPSTHWDLDQTFFFQSFTTLSHFVILFRFSSWQVNAPMRWPRGTGILGGHSLLWWSWFGRLISWTRETRLPGELNQVPRCVAMPTETMAIETCRNDSTWMALDCLKHFSPVKRFTKFSHQRFFSIFVFPLLIFFCSSSRVDFLLTFMTLMVMTGGFATSPPQTWKHVNT